MDKLAERLKVYIDTHPIDLGDGDCETVLDQLYHAYAESHESDPPEIKDSFKELDELLGGCRWMITILYPICAVAFVLLTNTKNLSQVCNTVLI